MKNIKPNDLNSIISNYVKDISVTKIKRIYKIFRRKMKEIEKETRIKRLNECKEYLNKVVKYSISKYLIPVDSIQNIES